jgi:hypothetical protein
MRYLMRNAMEWLLQLGLVLTIALVHVALRDALRHQRVREAASLKTQSAPGSKSWRQFWSR